MSLPERGRLDEHPLPRLLLDVYRASFSGTLTLSRDQVTKRVQLLDGTITFAESNLASESLGVQLLDERRISREDYSRVVGYVALKRCKEGKALLELQILAPKDLFRALKEQVRRRVVECFAWPSGSFELTRGQAQTPEAQAFRTDPVGLIQGALASHWSAERVYAALEPRLGCYASPGRRFSRVQRRLHVDAAVNRLLDGLDGSRTLGEAIHAAQSASALAAAWLLDAMEALDYADAPCTEEPPAGEDDGATPVSPDAMPEIEIVVDGARAAPRPAAPAEPAPQPRRSAPAGRAGGGDAETLRRAILATHERLDELDYYALLGVKSNATSADIRRAYFQLAKRYHPDALAAAGLDDVRGHAGEVFARVTRAHATLADATQRSQYDRGREDGADRDRATRVANAEVLYRKAEILLRKGDFKGALEFLRPAVELWPDDTAYQAALGWALFKKPKPELATAREHLTRAVELDEGNAVALYRLASVLRAAGDAEGAGALLGRARALDPKIDGRAG